MVDWDRVQELRAQGWAWADIARDPKVDFHPDASAGTPARALRALYHRTGHRSPRGVAGGTVPKHLNREEAERRWTLARIGWLAVPLVAVWFVLAYAAPSPVGLLVPAIPYLALALAGVAFVLVYALLRRPEGSPRWSPVYRNTVVLGIVGGLVVAGGAGLTASLAFGCPYLPPSSALSASPSPGWENVPTSAWTAGGLPVLFLYAATWCPYCSASSWAVYKALTEYADVTGVTTSHSSLGDIAPGTPEVVLAGAALSPRDGHGPGIAFQVDEDTSGIEPNVPPTTSCYQSAYYTSYGNGIPFIAINGQVVHKGTLVDPYALGAWNYANTSSSGPTTVLNDVSSEVGQPWSVVQTEAWWIMAFIAKYLGYNAGTVSALGGSSYFHWSNATLSAVTADLGSIT